MFNSTYISYCLLCLGSLTFHCNNVGSLEQLGCYTAQCVIWGAHGTYSLAFIDIFKGL